MKPSYEVLTRLPLFESIDPESARQAADMLKMTHFKVGDVILRQGEWQGELYIMRSGLVSVTSTDARGKSVELNRLGRGECFGEMALFTGQPPSATVAAVSDTHTWVLSQQDFVALMAGCPALAQNVSRIVSERLSTISGKYVARHLAQTMVLLDSNPGFEASVMCFNIAVSLARQTRRKVLLVELAQESDHAAPSSPGLGHLADLVEDKTLLQTHEAPMNGDNGLCGLRMGRLASSQEGNSPQSSDVLAVLAMLEPLYDYVLIHLSLGREGLYSDVMEHADRLFVLVRHHELSQANHRLDFLRALPNAGQRAGIVVVNSPQGTTMSAAKGLGAELHWGIEGILPGDATLMHTAFNPPFVLSNAGSPLSQAIDRVSRRMAKISVGVALGGGGPKGLAHLGVLRVLEEEGVPIDCVAGSSVGALIGALYAMGYDSAQLYDAVPRIISPAALRSLLSARLLGFSLASLLGGKGVEKELKGALGEIDFKDLRLPFAAVAADLNSGSEITLKEGPVYLAVRASVSIPGIFSPLRLGNHYLVDGGVLNPLPVQVAMNLGADIVIGVDLDNGAPLLSWPNEDARAKKQQEPVVSRNVVGILLRTVDIMQQCISERSTEYATVLVRPRFGPHGSYDFLSRQKQFVKAGEEAARETMPRLRAVLPWLAT